MASAPVNVLTLRFGLLTAAAALAVAAVVCAPDLAKFRLYGAGPSPLRAVMRGDIAYYQYRAHAAGVAGRPVNHPFYLEHDEGTSRFLLLDAAAAALTAIGVDFARSPVHGFLFLKAFSAAAIVALMAVLLRRWANLGPQAAALVAAATTLWQNTWELQEWYALTSWFMPFHLLGVLLALEGLRRDGIRRWLLLSGATVAFSTHPLSYALSSAVIGCLLLVDAFRRRSRMALVEAVAWGAFAVAWGLLLFGPFLFPEPSLPTADVLARAPLIHTRLPLTPALGLNLATVAILLALNPPRAEEGPRRKVWEFALCWIAFSALGTSANVITGTHFLNDHYDFLTRQLAVLAAAVAWMTWPTPDFAQLSKNETRMSARRRWAWLAVVFVAIYGLAVAADTPLRSFLILGRFVPFFLSMAVLFVVAIGRPRPAMDHARAKSVAVVLLAVSFAYALVFLWRLERGRLAADAEVQRYRPLIDVMASLPPGAVLGDRSAVDIASMQTAHRPYWTPRGWIDEASHAELERRWRDSLPFFGLEDARDPALVRLGLFGLESAHCHALVERAVYAPLKRAGLLGGTGCLERMDDDEIAAFIARTIEEESRAAGEGRWRPAYRLDWLILDRSRGETIPPRLEDRFAPEREAAEFAVYRFLQ